MPLEGAAEVIGALDDLNEALEQPADEATLREVGNFAVTLIVLRTKHGLDADRQPFAPYSRGYGIYRVGIGRADSPVDLAVTGHMLQALAIDDGSGTFRAANLHVDAAAAEVRVAFLSGFEAVKAGAHNFGVDKITSSRRSVYAQGIKVGTTMVTRRIKLPKREFMDIRDPVELDVVADATGAKLVARIKKLIDKARGA